VDAVEVLNVVAGVAVEALVVAARIGVKSELGRAFTEA